MPGVRQGKLTLSLSVLQVLCEENNILGVLGCGHQRSLCDYLDDYCSTNSIVCDPQFLARAEDAWNAESGPTVHLQ